RGPILCLGPGAAAATAQAGAVRAAGCPALALASGVDGADACDGALDPDALTDLAPLAAVISDAPTAAMRAALAKRSGPLVPLVTSAEIPFVTRLERHVCIDTTAAGGNATLLAQSG
ncbi:MAG: bifunctional proline dehydrogenase/L-glutamate gamma-semialdehyde dehydrogenase, partial [Pseudomonadota bacterium]